MRKPRPTIKFLDLVENPIFASEEQQKAFARGDFHLVDFYKVRHPLIDDAIMRFETGMPDRHGEHSKTAGRNVYEVRSRTGAAWRGAIVLDDAGDPWLVWAAKHTHFHSNPGKAAMSNITTWLPIPAEYKLRDHEDAQQARKDWQTDVLRRMIQGLVNSLHTNATTTVEIPSREDPKDTVRIDLIVESPDEPAAHLEESESLVTVLLRTRAPWRQELDDVIQTFVPLLLAGPEMPSEAAYTPDGGIELWCTVTHAKLAQLTASTMITLNEAKQLEADASPTHLHYTSTHHLTEAYVMGTSKRAVCGIWFVPTKDRHADLPVCPRCDDEVGAARLVDHVIRQSLAKSRQSR